MKYRIPTLTASALAVLALSAGAFAAPTKGSTTTTPPVHSFPRPFYVTGTITAIDTTDTPNTITITPAATTANPTPTPVVVTLSTKTVITGFQQVPVTSILVGDRLAVSGVPELILASKVTDYGPAPTTTTTTPTKTGAAPTNAAGNGDGDGPGAILGNLRIFGTVTALANTSVTPATPLTISLGNSTTTVGIDTTNVTSLTEVSNPTIGALATDLAGLTTGQTLPATAVGMTVSGVNTAIQISVTLPAVQ